jgi:hypothetical protein
MPPMTGRVSGYGEFVNDTASRCVRRSSSWSWVEGLGPRMRARSFST